jgi:predicted 3-demethylubiquinone-9 3-methyltransferase (glyoxalase superfamily)
MPTLSQKISPCLWFDNQAEEAANFYTSVFPNSKITTVTHYGEAGFEYHKRPAGSVMVVVFEIEGQSFTALNGGPLFQFNESVSFQILCSSQEELDHYWNKLTEGGDPKAQQCGWLKDKFGLSWQVLSDEVLEMLTDSDYEKSQRAMLAVMEMHKIDIQAVKQAYSGSLGR